MKNNNWKYLAGGIAGILLLLLLVIIYLSKKGTFINF